MKLKLYCKYTAASASRRHPLRALFRRLLILCTLFFAAPEAHAKHALTVRSFQAVRLEGWTEKSVDSLGDMFLQSPHANGVGLVPFLDDVDDDAHNLTMLKRLIGKVCGAEEWKRLRVTIHLGYHGAGESVTGKALQTRAETIARLILEIPEAQRARVEWRISPQLEDEWTTKVAATQLKFVARGIVGLRAKGLNVHLVRNGIKHNAAKFTAFNVLDAGKKKHLFKVFTELHGPVDAFNNNLKQKPGRTSYCTFSNDGYAVDCSKAFSWQGNQVREDDDSHRGLYLGDQYFDDSDALMKMIKASDFERADEFLLWRHIYNGRIRATDSYTISTVSDGAQPTKRVRYTARSDYDAAGIRVFEGDDRAPERLLARQFLGIP